MAIAVDATRTESVRTDTGTTYEFAYTPTTAPRGIVVTAIHADSATDHITGITYGGVAMHRVITAADSTTEPGRADIWYLGKGVPTGQQTVHVDLASGTTDDIEFVALGLNLGGTAADIAVVDSDLVENNTTNPSVLMSVLGRSAVTISAFYYGGSAAPVPNVNMTNLHTHDFTAQFGSVDMQTTPGTGDFTCSYTANDDTGLAVAAFAQAVVTPQAVAATQAHTAALVTNRGYNRALAATSSVGAALGKAAVHVWTIAASSSVAAALDKTRGLSQEVAATVTHLADLVAEFVSGAGHDTPQAINATTTLGASLAKTALHVQAVAASASAGIELARNVGLRVAADAMHDVALGTLRSVNQAIAVALSVTIGGTRTLAKSMSAFVDFVVRALSGTPATGQINGPTHANGQAKTLSSITEDRTHAVQDVGD